MAKASKENNWNTPKEGTPEWDAMTADEDRRIGGAERAMDRPRPTHGPRSAPPCHHCGTPVVQMSNGQVVHGPNGHPRCDTGSTFAKFPR